jgi:hypothetical protein
MLGEVSRTTLNNDIISVMCAETYAAAIEHYIVPRVAGLDVHDVPGVLPLKEKYKVLIYDKMKAYLQPLLMEKIYALVAENVKKYTRPLNYDALKELAGKIKKMDRLQEKRWDRFPELLQEESLFFRELQKRSGFLFVGDAFHDEICPFMEKVGEDIENEIGLDQILHANDYG